MHRKIPTNSRGTATMPAEQRRRDAGERRADGAEGEPDSREDPHAPPDVERLGFLLGIRGQFINGFGGVGQER